MDFAEPFEEEEEKEIETKNKKQKNVEENEEEEEKKKKKKSRERSLVSTVAPPARRPPLPPSRTEGAEGLPSFPPRTQKAQPE